MNLTALPSLAAASRWFLGLALSLVLAISPILLVVVWDPPALAGGARVLHVWKESPAPQFPYPDKLHGAHDVQDALDLAGPGDTVLVHGDCKEGQCRYVENLKVRCGVQLLGNGTPGSTPILDGGKKGPTVEGTPLLVRCRDSQITRVGYFCITNGRAVNGGGLRFFNRRVTIDHNCIHDNEAFVGGGIGVYLGDNRFPMPAIVIEDNLIGVDMAGRFGPNIAYERGGGVSIQGVYDNPSGVEEWHAHLSRNTIRKNLVQGRRDAKRYVWGGGLDVMNARVLARNNLFDDNDVEGGLENYGAAAAVLNMDEDTLASLVKLAAHGLGIAKTLEAPSRLDPEQYRSEGNIYRENGHPFNIRGGALAAIFNASVLLNGDWIVKNRGQFGGALYSSARSLIEVQATHVTENTAFYDGGGLYMSCGSLLDLLGGNKIDQNASQDSGNRPRPGGGGGIYVRNSQVRIQSGDAGPNEISGNSADKRAGAPLEGTGGYGGGILVWEVDKLLLFNLKGPGRGFSRASDVFNRLAREGEAKICNRLTKLVLDGDNLVADNFAAQFGGGVAILLQDDRESRPFVRSEILDGTQIRDNISREGGGIYYEERVSTRSSKTAARIQGAFVEGNTQGIMLVDAEAIEVRGSLIEANQGGGIRTVRSRALIRGNQIRGNTAVQVQVEADSDRSTLPSIVQNELDGFQMSDYGIRVKGGEASDVPVREWTGNNLIGHLQYAAFSQRFRIDMANNWWGAAGPVVTPPGTTPPTPNSVNPNILTDPPLAGPATVDVRGFEPIGVTPAHPTPPAEPVCTAPPRPPIEKEFFYTFASDRDGDFDVYEVPSTGPAGAQPTQLTDEPGYDAEAVSSPDGSMIAFTSNRAGGNFDVWVMSSDGSNPTRLTSHLAGDGAPAWQPGPRIAFFSARDGDLEVYTMNPDGSDQTNLTNDPARDWLPEWCPDGRIVFASNRDGGGNDDVWVMNADGTNPTQLTTHPATDNDPTCSPDGRQVAFVSDRDGNQEIYVLSLPAQLSGQPKGSEIRLTTNVASDAEPAYCESEGETHLLFVSRRDGNSELYRMNPDGTDQTRLTDNPATELHPSWRDPPPSTGAGARLVA